MEIADGIYTVKEVYTPEECQELIALSENIGYEAAPVGSSRVDLQACKLEYSIVSPK